MLEAVNLDAAPPMRADPRPVSHIGDTVIACQILGLTQLRIQHLEKATAFALVAIDRWLNFLREIAEKHIGLSHHGPNTAHLEHEPLDNARSTDHITRQELAAFFCKVDHDRTRFEDR